MLLYSQNDAWRLWASAQLDPPAKQNSNTSSAALAIHIKRMTTGSARAWKLDWDYRLDGLAVSPQRLPQLPTPEDRIR